MMVRYGIVVDLTRCTGCMTCVLACKEENFTPPGEYWIKVSELQGTDPPIYMPMLCVHCDNPPCVDACPKNAIIKRPDGIVIIDQNKCVVECGRCVEACPYGVIALHPDAKYFPETPIPYERNMAEHRIHKPGLAGKCTMCVHRVDQGLEPACVSGCPAGALIFGDLDDPNSAISKIAWKSEQLQAELGTKPKVTFITPPEVSLAAVPITMTVTMTQTVTKTKLPTLRLETQKLVDRAGFEPATS